MGSGSLTLNNSSNTTYDGSINGAGNVIKEGIGNLTIGGNNTYTGTTYINNGILNLTSPTGLGSPVQGTIVALGASLVLNNVNIGSEPLIIQGSGYNNNGAIISTGNSGSSGSFTYSDGTRINVVNGILLLTGTIQGGHYIKMGAGQLIFDDDVPSKNTINFPEFRDAASIFVSDILQIQLVEYLWEANHHYDVDILIPSYKNAIPVFLLKT